MECLGCAPLMPIREASARLGVSRRALRRLVDDGVLVRMTRGLVVGGCIAEAVEGDGGRRNLLHLDVLQQRYPDAAAGHESAALVLGLPVLSVPTHAVGLRAQGAWRSEPTCRIRIAPLPAHHVGVVDGRRTTLTPRTVVDVSRIGDLRAACVVGDAAMRRGCSRDMLQRTVDECAQWCDVGKARRAIELFDERAESAFESVSRATMYLYDVPMPELQVWVQGASGAWYRVDFLWRAKRLIGEADGMAKYLDDPRLAPKHVLRAEKERQEDLGDNGYDFVRWRYGPLVRQPAETMDRILRRLSR